MQQGLTTAFENAVVDPNGWGTALEVLAEATGSMRAQLVGFGGSRALPFNWITNITDRDMRLFAELDGHAPSVNFRVAADRTARREIVFEADYDQAMPELEDDGYRDFCEQTRMPFGCQTMLVEGEGGAVGLALLRSRRDGKTDERTRDMFRHAAIAARVAVRMQVALEQQGYMLIGNSLEAMAAACLLFDESGRLRTATPVAEARLTELDRLRMCDGRLVPDDPCLRSQLDRAFASLTGPDGPDHIRLPLRSASAARSPIDLDLFRVRRREWSFGFEPSVIGVFRTANRNVPSHSTLASTFGFTAAESAIAASLASGTSRQEIARERGVTVETLRGQLKTLYAKTGCGREAELVALLARMSE